MKKIISTVIILIIFVFGFYSLLKNQKENKTQESNQAQVMIPESNKNQDISPDLQIEVLEQGEGEEVKGGENIAVHYTGTLEDGTKFDSSLDRGKPFVFTLGIGQVIKRWDMGILGMKVGEKRKLVIPPELGYGKTGTPGGPIPPDATLIFEVELLSINK